MRENFCRDENWTNEGWNLIYLNIFPSSIQLYVIIWTPKCEFLAYISMYIYTSHVFVHMLYAYTYSSLAYNTPWHIRQSNILRNLLEEIITNFEIFPEEWNFNIQQKNMLHYVKIQGFKRLINAYRSVYNCTLEQLQV